MIVHSERTMVLYCPACLGIQHHVFSVFEVANHPHPLQCKCGFTQGHIKRSKNHYEINIIDLAGEQAKLLYSKKDFLRASLLVLREPGNGEIIGYMGKPTDAEESMPFTGIPKSAGEAYWDLEEFENPNVMYKVLEILQELANQGKITCECEHPSVGIDVYSDKVELVCSFCGSAVLIGAATDEDLERVVRLTEIVMEPSSYAFLDEWLKPLV